MREFRTYIFFRVVLFTASLSKRLEGETNVSKTVHYKKNINNTVTFRYSSTLIGCFMMMTQVGSGAMRTKV